MFKRLRVEFIVEQWDVLEFELTGHHPYHWHNFMMLPKVNTKSVLINVRIIYIYPYHRHNGKMNL